MFYNRRCISPNCLKVVESWTSLRMWLRNAWKFLNLTLRSMISTRSPKWFLRSKKLRACKASSCQGWHSIHESLYVALSVYLKSVVMNHIHLISSSRMSIPLSLTEFLYPTVTFRFTFQAYFFLIIILILSRSSLTIYCLPFLAIVRLGYTTPSLTVYLNPATHSTRDRKSVV